MDRWNSYKLDIETGRAEFMFLGHRDYVHGSSMLDVLLEMLKARHPHVVNDTAIIKSFRIIREFATGATAYVMPTAEVRGNPLLKDAVARLDLLSGNCMWTGFLVAEPEVEPLGRFDDYDSRDYVAHINHNNNGGAEVACNNVENLIDLLRSIIEGMLQTEWHEHGEDDEIVRMRWGYLSGFRILSDPEAANVKNFTLSPARVIQTTGQAFSIREITLSGADCRAGAEMCFFSELGK